MTTQKPLISPRISALEQELASGAIDTQKTALAAFWQTITEQGTPLIEPLADDDAHALVTFLWRDQGDTRNVVICAGPAGWEKPGQNQMMHLANSDLWYKTYRVRRDLRTVYLLAPNDPLTGEYENADFGERLLSDPLNPRTFVFPKDEEIADDIGFTVSILELPDAPPQPWIVPDPQGARGNVEMHRFQSHILNNERRVYVYTPPGYTTGGEAYGLLLLFDGATYINLVPTPTILDNLINQGKLPPLVAVLPDSLDQQTRNRELPCHQPFVDFLTQELLLWMHEHYHVTSDPSRSIVAGSSYGGLAASFVGLRASEHFGNILSQSGSYWWKNDPEAEVPQEWLTQQFMTSPHLPLRFYMEVGWKEPREMVLPNRHLRDVLTLKGYDVQYTEFNGGHDYICWRGSLADGLLALAGKK